MEVLVLLTIITWLNICFCEENMTTNSSDLNKDMYVIHALIYEVGIVTNATGDKVTNDTIGNQEALTLYHTNGSSIDLTDLPTPLITNVTAESLVGVAPKNNQTGNVPWTALDRLSKVPQSLPTTKTGDSSSTIHNAHRKSRRSWDSFKSIFKRNVPENNAAVKIVKGTAEIPEAAGVTSLALPPLLMLNNNMSEIPVPIPNVSVVHYAKINTLVTNTDKSEKL